MPNSVRYVHEVQPTWPWVGPTPAEADKEEQRMRKGLTTLAVVLMAAVVALGLAGPAQAVTVKQINHQWLWKQYKPKWKNEVCINAAVFGQRTAGRIEARSWRKAFKHPDSARGDVITRKERKVIKVSRTLPRWAVNRGRC